MVCPPYYKATINLKDFLEKYMSKYKEHYHIVRANAVTKLFPSSFSGLKVLDLGCGGGYYSLIMALKGATDIIVLDIEPLSVKATQLNVYKKLGIKICGVYGDCTYVPFKERSFDGVICINVIEHISQDDSLLKEVFRILKNNGFFILTARNPHSLNNIVQTHYMKHFLHINLTKKLKKHGFNIMKKSGTYFIPYFRFSSIFKSRPRLAKIFKTLLVKINDVFEFISDKPPVNRYGWELAYLTRKLFNA